LTTAAPLSNSVIPKQLTNIGGDAMVDGSSIPHVMTRRRFTTQSCYINGIIRGSFLEAETKTNITTAE
jgi:hypothetical protein